MGIPAVTAFIVVLPVIGLLASADDFTPNERLRPGVRYARPQPSISVSFTDRRYSPLPRR